jgi:hypothetical protein
MGGSVLLSLLAALALAAPSKPAAEGTGDEEARKLAVQSMREYNLGDFTAALRDIKRAYELSGRPVLLFNLAQCHRMLGHWKEAEFFYRGYLREKKDASNRVEVLHLIELVEAVERTTPPTETPAAPVTATPPPAATAPVPISTILPLPMPEAAPAQTATPLSPQPAATPPAPGAAQPVPSAAAPPAPPTALAEPPSRPAIPAASWWLGGSGAVAVVAGSILGGVARSNGNDDTGINHGFPVSTYNSGQYEGLAADIAWSVGGALIVAAVIVAFASH